MKKEFKFLLSLALSASIICSQTALTPFAADNISSIDSNSKEELISNKETYSSPSYVEDIDSNSDLSKKTENDVTTASQITVTLSENNDDTTAKNISPTFTITNNSNSDLNLTDLKLKYYYTADSEASQTFQCYYSGTTNGEYAELTSNVEGNIEKLKTPVENADSCMNITFNDGTLKAGQSMNVQTNVNKSDWSDYDRTNDYSYNDDTKVVTYINRHIVSGISPLKESTETKDDEISVTLSEDYNSTPNRMEPHFTITNNSDSDLDLSLSNLTIKYYFTSDTADDSKVSQTFTGSCLATSPEGPVDLNSNIEGNIEKIKAPCEIVDSCLNITFNGGTLKAGQSMDVQANIKKSDWSDYDKTNDYSYNDAGRVVVCLNGNTVSGTSPLDDAVKNKHVPILSMGGITLNGSGPTKIPIKISNIKDRGISKLHLKFSYPSWIFTFISPIENGSMLSDLSDSVFTGQGHDENKKTIDISFDLTKTDNVKALYEDGDYFYIPFDVHDYSFSTTVSLDIADAVITDGDGNEFTGDNLIIQNNPITYPGKVIKDSFVSSNYITYDENTLKDISIPVEFNGNNLVSVRSKIDTKLETDDDTMSYEYKLTEGKDYIVDNNIIILKKEFLKKLLNRNVFIYFNFNSGNGHKIFINNKPLEPSVDSSKTICKDEPNASFSQLIQDDQNIVNWSTIGLGITNTSNVNMDLDKLSLNFYYKKSEKYCYETISTIYAANLESNKNLLPYTIVSPKNFEGEDSFNEKSIINVKFKNEAGILKPGETVFVYGSIFADYYDIVDTNRTKFQEPTIIYDDDVIYGKFPDQYLKNSELVTKNIEVNSDNIEDIPIALKLNGNLLYSIDLYSNNTLKRKLIKGTDYIINKRNEIILKKSFLDSITDKYSTLNFIFNYGDSCSLDILKNLKSGLITLSNKESIALGGTNLTSGKDISRWNDLIVPVTINNSNSNSDEKISSANFTLNFDKSLFDKVSIEPVNCSPKDIIVNPSSGTINIKINNMSISPNDTTLFNIVAHPSGKILPQKIDFTLSDDSYYVTSSGAKYKPVYKYNNVELMYKYGDVKLSTETVSAKQGETISIPIYVDYADHYNIGYFKTSLLYDTHIFESAKILPGDVFNETLDDFVSTNDTEKGRVSVSCNNRVSKNGTLMKILLKVKDDAPTGSTSLINDLDFDNEMSVYDYKGYRYSTYISNRIPCESITITE